ncbi:hypothetical protein Tco_0007474 [Tanacetum coccineum]
MDSIIPLGQKNTLAEYMILFSAKNRPPMLDKDMYDSWKSRMELYMQNREQERMILESVENGPLIWPTVEENGVTRTKKYPKLSAAEKIQADCDMKATNIILQGLPTDIYSLVYHHRVAKDLWERVQLLMQGDDPIACLNKAMAFLTVVASSRFPSTNNQLRTSSNPRNQATIQDGRVTVQKVQGRQGKSYSGVGYKSNATSSGGNNEAVQILDEEQLAFLADLGVPNGQAIRTIIPNNAAFQTEDLDTYDSDCDDISNAKVVLMANISNYGSDVILEVPHSETYINDMENQSVHAIQDFEQAQVVDFVDNEIHSTTRFNDLICDEQMLEQMINHRLNIDLSNRGKMIDSQMDDMIKEKLTPKEQADLLEQNLSKQIKEKECLLQTFIVFKNESKEKENKYMENEIDFEKRIKELDNIIFKVVQSAQIVHMLTKPQPFYDSIQKHALGYQNPFYLKKAQRIKPTLYDGIVISDKHVAMPVIDDEETLILEEDSRSKTKPSDASPVKIEAPKELPKVSLVNESLKKLKFYLARFENVVKIRTTPDAHTEGEWGFEHTKAVFNNEIIPFLKSLKDIFNVFDKDLLNEIMEKELLLENDRLLQQIMSQDVLVTMMNSMSLNGEYVNMDRKRNESCDKCFNLDAELLKSQNAHNDLLQSVGIIDLMRQNE